MRRGNHDLNKYFCFACNAVGKISGKPLFDKHQVCGSLQGYLLSNTISKLSEGADFQLPFGVLHKNFYS
jgi:hypothetical protein